MLKFNNQKVILNITKMIRSQFLGIHRLLTPTVFNQNSRCVDHCSLLNYVLFTTIVQHLEGPLN